MRGLSRGFLASGGHQFRLPRGKGQRGNASSSSASNPTSQGLFSNPVLKAGLISGSMSVIGDALAQFLTLKTRQSDSYDFVRGARMGSFGLAFYGPYQHYWYKALESYFPLKNAAHFLTKVTLNQLLLAPVVLTAVFSWNLALQGQASDIQPKIKRDLVPSMINGWKFWVPAASINFWLIPLPRQVLYMSCCGVLWTAYLSFSSSMPAKRD